MRACLGASVCVSCPAVSCDDIAWTCRVFEGPSRVSKYNVNVAQTAQSAAVRAQNCRTPRMAVWPFSSHYTSTPCFNNKPQNLFTEIVLVLE